MSLRLYGTISGWGRSAGAVIPALGSGRYSPGPNIVLPSWLQGSAPHFTLNVFWGQPGALATVSAGATDPVIDEDIARQDLITPSRSRLPEQVHLTRHGFLPFLFLRRDAGIQGRPGQASA